MQNRGTSSQLRKCGFSAALLSLVFAVSTSGCNPELVIRSTLLTTATPTPTATPVPIGSLAWSSAPTSAFKLQCTPYQITRRLPDGSADSSSSSLSVAISSSAGGSFFSNVGCTVPITSATVPGNQSQVTVYYKGTTAGTKTLTASEGSLQSGVRSAVISNDLFGDDFSSGSVDSSRWDQWSGAIPVVVQSNVATLIPIQNSTWSGFNSHINFDFTGHEVVAEVTLSNGFDIVNNYAVLYLCGTGACYDLAVWGGNLTATIDGGATYGSTPYVPAQHRFWKIAHDSGTDQILFSYSADGVTWTLLTSTARGFGITNSDTEVGTGGSGPGTMYLHQIHVQ